MRVNLSNYYYYYIYVHIVVVVVVVVVGLKIVLPNIFSVFFFQLISLTVAAASYCCESSLSQGFLFFVLCALRYFFTLHLF